MSPPISLVVKADRTSEVADLIRTRAAHIVEKAARDIEGTASVNVVSMGAVDTGNLLGSIASAPVRSDGLVWKVYAGAEYAAYVNFGTVHMGARPFFTDAVDKVRPVFVAAMRQLPGIS